MTSIANQPRPARRLQATIRHAKADGNVTPRERKQIKSAFENFKAKKAELQENSKQCGQNRPLTEEQKTEKKEQVDTFNNMVSDVFSDGNVTDKEKGLLKDKYSELDPKQRQNVQKSLRQDGHNVLANDLARGNHRPRRPGSAQGPRHPNGPRHAHGPRPQQGADGSQAPQSEVGKKVKMAQIDSYLKAADDVLDGGKVGPRERAILDRQFAKLDPKQQELVIEGLRESGQDKLADHLTA
jgi:hypothetical protein